MPAPHGNRNAAKDDADKLSAHLNMRVHPREKAAWERAAGRAKRGTAAEWIRATLNAAAGFDAERVLGRDHGEGEA
jgi:hypothetical protein